jgi:Domain of unknown function (DUF5658)
VGIGITSLPSVRSTEGQFPYWLGVDDRLIADEYFRGSYTSGVWLKGEFHTKVKYQAMFANNLSTLGVSAAQLDNRLDTQSYVATWLPTTGEFGQWNTFGNYDDHQKLATRISLHYTSSREEKRKERAMTPRAVHLILIVFVLATGVTVAASAQSGWALDQTDDCTLPAVSRTAVETHPLAAIRPVELFPPAVESTSHSHADAERPAVLPVLYVSTVALQVLDAHSTLRAVAHGSREINMVMAPVVDSHASWLAVKTLAAAGTIYFAEKAWRHNPVATVVVLAIINAVQAAVVIHNYNLETGRRR